MQLKIDNQLYPVEIIKKKSNRNTYIRVKEDLTIYVTTNNYTKESKIIRLLEESIPSIRKMISHQEKKNNFKNDFWYLGRKYDVIYTNQDAVLLGDGRIFIPKNMDIEKWYKREANKLFQEHLDDNYRKYTRKIPYPSLTVRKMTTRWGVCNTRLKKVTLNLELIKKDPICLDYVIMHELTHFIHPDHSRNFWDLVEENFPNYKEVRKMMKEY